MTLEELDKIILRLEDLEKTMDDESQKSPNPNKQERHRLKSQKRKLSERNELY